MNAANVVIAGSNIEAFQEHAVLQSELLRIDSFPSDLVTEHNIRMVCARMVCLLFARARKVYGGITAKKLSGWRQTGGAFGDVCVVMYANPEKAQHIAALFQGHADAITARERIPLIVASRNETIADSADDLPQEDVKNNPNDVEALQRAIDAADAVIANTRAWRLSLAQQLDEVTSRARN